jgi:hypothetical protein
MKGAVVRTSVGLDAFTDADADAFTNGGRLSLNGRVV